MPVKVNASKLGGYMRLPRARARMTPDKLQRLAEYVMREKGPGYSESVYHECLRTLLESKGFRHRSQVTCPITFLGQVVGAGRADLVIGDLVVEIKANKQAPSDASPQLRGYLDSLLEVENRRCTGIVVNFSQRGGVSCLILPPPEAEPEVVSRFFKTNKRKRAA